MLLAYRTPAQAQKTGDYATAHTLLQRRSRSFAVRLDPHQADHYLTWTLNIAPPNR